MKPRCTFADTKCYDVKKPVRAWVDATSQEVTPHSKGLNKFRSSTNRMHSLDRDLLSVWVYLNVMPFLPRAECSLLRQLLLDLPRENCLYVLRFWHGEQSTGVYYVTVQLSGVGVLRDRGGISTEDDTIFLQWSLVTFLQVFAFMYQYGSDFRG